MIELPPRVSLADALPHLQGRVGIWASPSVREWARQRLPWPVTDAPEKDLDWLVGIGGGTLMDQAKAWKLGHPGLRLALMPSLWGSGAEASPVVVLDHAGEKHIRVDAAALPDLVIAVPELAASVPESRARWACGDAWAHALEGWLSPLASDTLRSDLGAVVAEMCALNLGSDPRWFELSARACAGQARSSVGLVHGVAHELEAPLREGAPAGAWHHARLCSLYLLPVMRYNQRRSPKFNDLAQASGVDLGRVWQRLEALHDRSAYQATLGILQERWPRVLRNPCSRTNSVVINAQALEFLLAFSLD